MPTIVLSPAARAASFAFALLLLLAPARVFADSITLHWDPAAPNVTGYAVYTGPRPDNLSQRVDVGNVTAFTIADPISGRQYCFAVSSYVDPEVEGPRSPTVCGYSNESPSLTSPGNQSTTAGQQASLQLAGSDPEGQPLTYSATGLPPGLSLGWNTGFISGVPTTPGTYTVSASVSDGVLSSPVRTFSWVVSNVSQPDSTVPLVTITTPTTGNSYASSSSTIVLAGTASDNVGVTSVTWISNRGGNGTATGTTSWQVPTIGLLIGQNVITVRARDAAGNMGTDVLTVSYTPDSTGPQIRITSPTQSSGYSTSSPTVTLGGTAADNVGVTQVQWVNNRGGSGTATGTANWTAAVALQTGQNVINVIARDAAGNTANDVITVTYTIPAGDTVAPTIRIVGPTTVPTYTTTSSTLALSGTSSDDRGVTAITWTNDRGGSGFASGTNNWSVASIPLMPGTNVITLIAQDAAGNRGTDGLSVTYSASGPTSIVLSGVSSGNPNITLTWTGATGSAVEVYRNGSLLGGTPNDGQQTLASPGGTTFQVCLPNRVGCSNSVVVHH